MILIADGIRLFYPSSFATKSLLKSSHINRGDIMSFVQKMMKYFGLEFLQFRVPPKDRQGNERGFGYKWKDFALCPKCIGDGGGHKNGKKIDYCSSCGGYGDIPIESIEIPKTGETWHLRTPGKDRVCVIDSVNSPLITFSSPIGLWTQVTDLDAFIIAYTKMETK